MGAARKLLSESDGLIAKVYRELKRSGQPLSMLDEVMLAEAAAAGDLSVLLAERGRFLMDALEAAGVKNPKKTFAALSDLMGAITKENVGGNHYGFGHGRSYYTGAYSPIEKQGTEALANLTDLELYRSTDKLLDEVVKAFVPNFTKWYDELLDTLNASISG